MQIKKNSLSTRTGLGACFLCVMLSACHSSKKDEESNIDIETQLSTQDIQGIWDQKGYGQLLLVEDNEAKLFEFTRASCLQTDEIGSEEFEELLNTITLSEDKNTLKRQSPSDLFSDSFHKREALPEFCEPDMQIEDSTPSIVFNHFWHSFNDYYAFFNERNVDWEAQGAKYQPLVSDDMNDEQLFTVLAEMIDPLDDDHVELGADSEEFEAGFSTAHDAFEFENELEEAFEQQTEFDDLDEYTQFNISEAKKLFLKPVNNLNQAGLSNEDIPPAIYWGTINGSDNSNIGYIHISRMLGFDESIDLDSDDFEINEEDDMQALNAIMERVIVDLKDTSSMIIDVRLNAGGSDFASITITNQFATDRIKVISKFARSYNGNSETKHAYTTPVSEPYTSPVIVLSSQETGSAAEIFLMAMNALPNVTLMGKPSNGRLSDMLEKVLPNEWEFSLSNEVYSDSLNRRLEVSGVPVDVEVDALTLSNIQQGKDTALEKALSSF